MTKPVDDILPLPINAKAKQIIDFYYSALHELVCFGTHVLAWNLEKGKDRTDLGTEIDMAVPLLFRHLLELIDAISVQVQSGVVSPCRVYLRAFLEAYLSLEYILEKDHHRRSACFMIVDHYRKLNFYKKLVHNSKENIELQQELDKFGYIMKKISRIENADKAYNNMASLINKPIYNDAREEYLLRTKNNTTNLDIKWYNLFSKNSSVKWLSKHLHRYDLYEFFYKEWSNPTHGTNLHTGVLVLGDDGLGAINQIRNLEDAHQVTSQTITLTILLYSSMLKKVVSEHKREHAEWHIYYKEAFRNKIDNME